MAIGMISVVIPMVIYEISSVSKRAQHIVLVELFFTIGLMVGLLVRYVIPDFVIPTEYETKAEY